jgi:hypothetical protein
LAFFFCLPCDGSNHWSFIEFLLLFKGCIPIAHPSNMVINHPVPLDSKGAKPALGLGGYLIVLITSDFRFWIFFEFFEIIYIFENFQSQKTFCFQFFETFQMQITTLF